MLPVSTGPESRPGPRPGRSHDQDRRASLIVGLVIAAAVFGVWSNALDTPFLPDDEIAISMNEDIRSLNDSLRAVADQRFSSVSGRPLASFSLAVNWAIGQANPRGYHLLNIALHVVVAWLIFGLLLQMLRHRRFRQPIGDAAPWVAGAIAMLWALHPLQTEALDVVVNRTEILVSLFIVLAILASIRGAGRQQRRWSVIVVVAGVLGALTKEVSVVTPVLVLAYDRFFLAGSLRGALRARPAMYAVLAALTWGVVGLLQLGHPRALSAGFGLGISWWEYLLTQAGVITHYLRLALWPDALAINYQDWPIAHGLTDAIPAGLIVATLVVAGGVAVGRGSSLGFACIWFFVLLAPSSSIVPVVTEIAAERRMYLALLPVVAIPCVLAVGLVRRLARPRERRFAQATLVAAGVAALAGLGGRTWVRNLDYQSDESIWRDAVRKRPRNPVAHGALAFALERHGDLVGAEREHRTALGLDPRFADSWVNLGHVLRKQGRHREARRAFSRGMQLIRQRRLELHLSPHP